MQIGARMGLKEYIALVEDGYPKMAKKPESTERPDTEIKNTDPTALIPDEESEQFKMMLHVYKTYDRVDLTGMTREEIRNAIFKKS